MVQHEYYWEQVKAFRSVFNKAMFFDKEKQIRDYLALEFDGMEDLFCQFIGFCSAELKDPAVKVKRHKLVTFMIALAMESLSQGRKGGHNGASRITALEPKEIPNVGNTDALSPV